MKKFLFLIPVLALLTISKAFSCNANYTHTYACAGDTLFFDALDQNAVYTWDFGDTTSGVANISHDTDSYHVYINPGTYFVTLFVNIGAEWDYQTQILTIGTDCFVASFKETCAGNNDFNFKNESTGNIISSLWNFGDPSSGAADTSTSLNAYHQYAGPGFYTVTLIVNDGNQTDTLVKQIEVKTTCLNTTFYNFLGGDCYQNMTTINVAYSGAPTSYYWDFGDPSSGIANYSTDSLGVHQFSSAGIYLLTLIVADGFRTDTFYNVQNIIDCDVYPGNSNLDGEVNMEDLFAIGLAYNDTGRTRFGSSFTWYGQPAYDWSENNWDGNMYLQRLVDKKHADCNGDGIVNNLDLAAIDLNYGAIHPNYFHNDKMQPLKTRSFDPVLEVNPGISQFIAGDTVQLSIDLSAIDSVRNMYGIAARIYYDNNFIVPGSMSISFYNSWFGTWGADMLPLAKDFYNYGYIDFGITRTNSLNTTGNGTIATLSFVSNYNTGVMNFSIDPEIKLISSGVFSSQELFYPVNTNSTQIGFVVTGIGTIDNTSISIYPNPANETVTVSRKDNLKISEWNIYDGLGRNIRSSKIINDSSFEISTSDLTCGIYSIELVSNEKTLRKQIIVLH